MDAAHQCACARAASCLPTTHHFNLAALSQAVLTRGYQGINFILLNRGGAVTQTVNFSWYYGNKSNGQQWVWQVRLLRC